jgi:hypothetical protein
VKPEKKRTLGKPIRSWEDNIKMDLQEVGCAVWPLSSWLRIGAGGGHCKCDNKHSGFAKCGEFLNYLKTG